MKKITFFLFSLFCVLSLSVNAQDDGGVAGCTDATACNYDEGATANDGSCTFAVAGYDCAGNCLSGEAVTLNLYDSYGDGWASGATTLTIAGVDYTMATGSSVEFGLCLDLDLT